MGPSDAATKGHEPKGEVLVAISNGIVRLYREHFGRSPTGAKTYALDDLIVCVLRDGLTMAEKTMFEHGRGGAVRELRASFHEAVSERFTGIVERHTERKVVAFMSQAHVDPDLAIEVFFLDPAPDAAGDGRPPT